LAAAIVIRPWSGSHPLPRRSSLGVAPNVLGDKQCVPTAQVGMRVYGGTVFDGKGACTDSQNVVPVGPVDRKALATQIAKDLGDNGKRSIVLVSDGEATCDPDPCEVAKQLAGSGVDLKIDVVGLRVNAAVERRLQCIARAGNGDYADARDAADLVRGLNRLSVRALRSFVLSGTRSREGPLLRRPRRPAPASTWTASEPAATGSTTDCRRTPARPCPSP
jgi:hypothetical protein